MSWLTRDREAAESDAERESERGAEGGPGVGHHDEEDGLHAEPAAVEDLADVGGAHDALLADVVGQHASARDNHGHQQVRQRAHEPCL